MRYWMTVNAVAVFGTVLLAVAVGAIIAAAVIVRRRLRGGAAGDAPASTDQRMARTALRRAVIGASLAWAAELILLAAAPSLSLSPHTVDLGGPSGLALGLAPACAGLVALAILALTEVTWPRPLGLRRTASLSRRRIADVACRPRRWWMWAGVAVTAVVTVVCGVTADGTGKAVAYRVAEDGDVTASGSVGPFPGWPYGIPLLVGCVAVAVGAEALLRLVTSRPAVEGVTPSWDMGLRRLSAARQLRMAQLPIWSTAAGMLLVAGTALRRLDRGYRMSYLGSLSAGPWGTACLAAGIVVLAASVVAACLPARNPQS